MVIPDESAGIYANAISKFLIFELRAIAIVYLTGIFHQHYRVNSRMEWKSQ
jgi:hypothetical protein